MKKQTQRQPVSRIPDHFPCPRCQRLVKVGEKFCGFCKKPLLAQCPTCGNWTKANHTVCPECASPLHKGGRTFAESQKLARLQGDLREQIAEYAATEQRLDDLLNERNSAVIRLLVVVLVSVVLFAFGAPVVAFLNALGVWGVIVVIVALVTFGAVAIVIVSAYIRLCRWGSIVVVIEIQKDISKARAYLKDLEVEIAELEETIASLKAKGIRSMRPYTAQRQSWEEDEEWCRHLEDVRDWMREEEERQNASATREEEQQPISRPNGSVEIQPSSEAFGSSAQPIMASDKDAVSNIHGEEDIIEAEVVELVAEEAKEDDEVGKNLKEEEPVNQDKEVLVGDLQDDAGDRNEEEEPVVQSKVALVQPIRRGGKGGAKEKRSRKRRFPQ